MGRIGYTIGSALLLFGAFAIGGVLHAVFVKGTASATSPFAVFGVLAGVALVAAGYRLEQANQESIIPDIEGGDEEEPDEDEFDEEMAPFDAEDLEEKYERDDDT